MILYETNCIYSWCTGCANWEYNLVFDPVASIICHVRVDRIYVRWTGTHAITYVCTNALSSLMNTALIVIGFWVLAYITTMNSAEPVLISIVISAIGTITVFRLWEE